MKEPALSRSSTFGLTFIIPGIMMSAAYCAPDGKNDNAADRARWKKRAEQILKKPPPERKPVAAPAAKSPKSTPASEKPIVRKPAAHQPTAGTLADRIMRRGTHTRPVVTPETIFADAKDDAHLFQNHRRRYRVFRNPRIQKRYNTRRTRGTVQIQYSDHKRLFDHNILLAEIFAGRLVNPRVGNLKKAFRGALFFDLGSAILYKQGAVTVRAIQEDPRIMPFLSKLVASDINDYRSAKTEFINIYRKRAKQLPFAVEEIDMSITRPVQVEIMLREHLKHAYTPVILRTVNTGIDYYYSESQLRRHFQAVLTALSRRNVIYLFNRFVLLKPAGDVQFIIVGEIAPLFRAENQKRRGKIWRRINWDKRHLRDGFTPRKQHIRIIETGANAPLASDSV